MGGRQGFVRINGAATYALLWDARIGNFKPPGRANRPTPPQQLEDLPVDEMARLDEGVVGC
jgi:hypothetical protein